MKSNVKPGMLAYVIAPKNGNPVTPGILGRVVYVERLSKLSDIFQDVNGNLTRNTGDYTELTWIISAKEPLPCLITFDTGISRTVFMYERPMIDSCLRPLLDPNIDVTDEEVKELYSNKELECQM